MTALVARVQPRARWEHVLLGLRDPSVRVAVVSDVPVEPALLAYYLELAGVGPWDRVSRFAPENVAGLRAFVGADAGAPRSIDPSFAWGEPGASRVHVVIH